MAKATVRARLEDALDALSEALDDLDQWASAGAESYTPDERKRRANYERALERGRKALRELDP